MNLHMFGLVLCSVVCHYIQFVQPTHMWPCCDGKLLHMVNRHYLILPNAAWLQDSAASQQNGGNLVFSTTGTATSAGLTDRLTIDSSGLATFAASLTLASTSSTLTASGNTVLGTGSTNTLTVNAAAQFSTAITAASSLSVAGTFTTSGSSTLGTSSSNTLTVNAAATFNAAAAYGSALTVAGLLTAIGNTILGSSSSNTLTVNAAATFNAGAQLYGNSNTAATAPTMSYLRQYPSAAAAATNAVVGVTLFSRWDGSAYNPTAQMRSIYTVSSWLTGILTCPLDHHRMSVASFWRMP